jgi:hypothetical protein
MCFPRDRILRMIMLSARLSRVAPVSMYTRITSKPVMGSGPIYAREACASSGIGY